MRLRRYAIGTLAVIFLTACGGGGGGGTATPTGVNTVVAKQTAFDSNPTCPNGGVQIDIGIDENGNGVLDPAEVDNVDYLCNGADGAAGADGLTSLVVVSPETAGANCADGGLKVEVGLDDSLDGILDSAELDTTTYICDGAQGPTGTDGLDSLVSVTAVTPDAPCVYGGIAVDVGTDDNINGVLDSAEIDTTTYVCNGADGTAGTTGSAGTDGFNSLVETSPEGSGPNCTWGGIRFEVGLDDDRSGTLEEGEVDATRYVCYQASGGLINTLWYVDLAASGATEDGLTWATAFRHPQDAMDAAIYGDQIWVAAGTYTTPQYTLELLHMNDGVQLYGGFSGTETALGQRDWQANPTVLDGQGAFHVVYGADNARLDGFTVTGGVADDLDGELSQGGGMYNYRVTPVVVNCVFTGNRATFGGGMYNWGNFPTLENVTFDGNSADLGGGVYSHASVAMVSSGSFIGNTATEGGGFYTTFRSAASFNSVIFTANMATAGAGILADGEVPVELTSSTLSSNLASSGSGGEGLFSRGGTVTVVDSAFGNNGGDGILNLDGNVTVVDSVFGGNSGGSIRVTGGETIVTGSTFDGDYGYGVYVDGGTLEAANSSFTGYTQFGAALYASNSTNVVTSCLFTGNKRNQSGGAVYLNATANTFRRVTFTGNGDDSYASLFGGALYAGNSTGTFTTCDFTNNSTGNSGGAVYASGSYTFTGCTFTGNSSVHDGGAALTGDGVFNNCTFDGNAATGSFGDGGAVYTGSREAEFTSCLFTGNSAGANGGAMFVNNGSNTAGSGTNIVNSQFTGNQAAGSGGGIGMVKPYHLTITASSITGNAASVEGGGLANGYTQNVGTYGGTVTLTDSVVSGNTAGGHGGGVSQWNNGYFETFTMALNSDITGNTAGGNGGGFYLNRMGRSSLDGLRITGNTAGGNGGAVYVEYGGPVFTNTIMSGNSAAEGGGVYTFGFDSSSPGNVEINNVTITGNLASGVAGGLFHGGEPYVSYSIYAPHTIVNSVLWANSGAQAAYVTSVQDPYIPLSVTWSDVMTAGASTPYAGTGNINADPLFAAYGTWSGGVWTDGDYRLLAGSPAIDAGDSSAVVTSFDFDGLPRVYNNSVVDMGAYEYQGP